jgi:hypothetical protein
MKIFTSPLLVSILFFSTAVMASPPVFDKKLSDEKVQEKCKEWAKDQVKGISDSAKRNTAFKQPAQDCSRANKIPHFWIFKTKI